jgi:capsule polysaccharide export protein KpsE/RkpR
VDGFQTPYSISRFKNDEMVRQYYVTKVSFNQELASDFWSVDVADKRIKK